MKARSQDALDDAERIPCGARPVVPRERRRCGIEQPLALARAIGHFLGQKRRTLAGTRETIERDFRPAAAAAQYRAIYAEIAGSG